MSSFTSKFKSTPTFTFKSRYETITNNNQKHQIPSPGHYDNSHLDLSTTSHVSGKFTKTIKALNLNINKMSPGPGAYETVQFAGKSSFNKRQILKQGQQRFKEVNNKQSSPSPQSYNIKDTTLKSQPKFSMCKTTRQISFSKSQDGPSPNLYKPKIEQKSKIITITIGKSQRKINMNISNNPGPGAYSTEKSIIQSSFNQKNKIIPQAKRTITFQSTCEAPGPGAYSSISFINDNQKKNRGFTWKRRYSTSQLITPGPNAYHNQTMTHKFKSIDGPKMQQSSRMHFLYDAKNSVPGPGTHDISALQAHKFKTVSASKFPKTKLPHFVAKQQNKIDYANPQKLNVTHKSLPKFSISHAKRQDLYEDAFKSKTCHKFYDSNLDVIRRSTTHAFTISQTHRLKYQSKIQIGPGYYKPEQSKISQKKAKFSKEKRKTFLDQVIKTKLSIFKNDSSHQGRQQFPNPPKYMNVYKKLQINEKKISH